MGSDMDYMDQCQVEWLNGGWVWMNGGGQLIPLLVHLSNVNYPLTQIPTNEEVPLAPVTGPQYKVNTVHRTITMQASSQCRLAEGNRQLATGTHHTGS